MFINEEHSFYIFYPKGNIGIQGKRDHFRNKIVAEDFLPWEIKTEKQNNFQWMEFEMPEKEFKKWLRAIYRMECGVKQEGTLKK